MNEAFITTGRVTFFVADWGVEDLGSPGEDERWKLVYPAVPDDASELEEPE